MKASGNKVFASPQSPVFTQTPPMLVEAGMAAAEIDLSFQAARAAEKKENDGG